jgi:hypothetical protein
MEDFIVSGGFNDLSEAGKIDLITSLVSWIRLDIALGKHVHLPNYLVVAGEASLEIVSVDHESSGDYAHPVSTQTPPSAVYCLGLFMDQINSQDRAMLNSRAFQEGLSEKSRSLFERFVAVKDFDILHSLLERADQPSNLDRDFSPVQDRLQLAQVTVARWLSQL